MEDKFTNLDGQFVNLAEKVNTEVKEIKTTVSEFHNKISSKIESMNYTLQQHTYRLANNDDDMQRIQLSQDVRLVGFAVKENEDLVGIFRKLANHIGYSVGDNIGLPLIERITKKSCNWSTDANAYAAHSLQFVATKANILLALFKQNAT